jgi:hypothetical protein
VVVAGIPYGQSLEGIKRVSKNIILIITACCALNAWADEHPITNGLILDLNADKGVTLEDGDMVINWKNQVSDFTAQDFAKRDEGRSIAGSGRPTLKKDVPELSGHNSIVFLEDELLNMDESAFDHLIQGSGYTWLAVMSAYTQDGKLEDVNVFLGNLQNGGKYEGFWAGLEDDNDLWLGSRNGITFGRYNADNPKLMGPRLEANKYYIVAGRMGAGTGTVQIDVFVDDPTPKGSVDYPVNAEADSSKMAIGTERDATNHPGVESFDGELARVLLYERPLSDGEMDQTIASLKQTYFKAAPAE